MAKLGLSFLLLVLLAAPVVAQQDGKPIDEVLHGRFVALDKDRVTIRYDLSDPIQLQDWFETKPFRVAGDLDTDFENKAVKLTGTGALLHRAVFDGDVSIEFVLIPWKEQDLGVIITENPLSDQYVLFSLNDLHFQKFDGAKVPGHMITRFGIVDPSEPKGAFPFRYITRAKKPDIRRHHELAIKAEKKNRDYTFGIGEDSLSGMGLGRKLLDLHIGLYVVDSDARADEIVVKGKLSARWLEKEGIALRLSRPIETEEPGEKAERAAQARLEEYRDGALEAEKLLDVIEDVDVEERTREAAAEALIEGEEKSIVPHLVPLLYSTDEVTRELAGELVKKLVGKSFGYSAKADEDRRRNAVRKIVQYVQKNADEFR